MTATATLPPLAPAKSQTHIPALDGLRGVAVLGVLICHCGYLSMLGQWGVDTFFVLSGYLITWLLLAEIKKTGRFSFKHFYMRRVLRLFPALLLMVAGTILAMKLIGYHVRNLIEDGALAVLYISNWTLAFGKRPTIFGHTWSLSVEEQYYLIWPMMAVLLSRRSRKTAFGVCIVAVIVVTAYRSTLIAMGASVHRVYFPLDTRLDPLLAGSALAFVTPKIGRRAAILLGWAGLLGSIAYFVWVNFNGVGYLYYVGTVTIVLACSMLLSILNARHSSFDAVLSMPWLTWVGRISYGLYLYQFPITTYLTEYRLLPKWQVFCIAVPLTFAVATASYYLVERPCLRLKRFFR